MHPLCGGNLRIAGMQEAFHRLKPGPVDQVFVAKVEHYREAKA
jgi:hypothetical protein